MKLGELSPPRDRSGHSDRSMRTRDDSRRRSSYSRRSGYDRRDSSTRRDGGFIPTHGRGEKRKHRNSSGYVDRSSRRHSDRGSSSGSRRHLESDVPRKRSRNHAYDRRSSRHPPPYHRHPHSSKQTHDGRGLTQRIIHPRRTYSGGAWGTLTNVRRRSSTTPHNHRSRSDGEPSRFADWIINKSRETAMDYAPLLATEESHYSSLLPKHLDQVQQLLMEYFKNDDEVSRVVDATAHIGCDTLLFALLFPRAKRVDAVELSEDTFKLLEENAKNATKVLRGKPHAPIFVHNQSCVEYLKQLKEGGERVDMVYFDPPWGGRDYNKVDQLTLYLDDKPLGEVVGDTLKHLTSLVVVKAPVNINEHMLFQRISEQVSEAKKSMEEVKKGYCNRKGDVAYRLYFFEK